MRSGVIFSWLLVFAHEMDVWINYCTQPEYVASETGQEWKQSYEQIVRMLQKLYSKAK